MFNDVHTRKTVGATYPSFQGDLGEGNKGEGMAGIFEEPLSSKNGVREMLGMRLEI